MPEFKCELCGKEFEQSTSLQQHIRDKHTQPAPESQIPQNTLNQVNQAETHHNSEEQHHSRQKDGKKVKLKISKNSLYIVILVVVVASAGYGAYTYIGSQPTKPTTSSAPTAQLGALGSNHIHADLAIYMEGTPITPFSPRYYVKSPYMHVESGPGEGYVLHMHAINTPLSIFFRSIGMTYNSECFRLDNGKEYCNDGEKRLRMFVKHDGGQWEENRQFHTYIFQDLDKILITYGNDSPDEIKKQQDSVTDWAKDNTGRQMDLSRFAR